MQTVTVAIAPAGVQYIGQQLLLAAVQSQLSGLVPANNTLYPAGYSVAGYEGGTTYSSIEIQLTQGQLTGFAPTFQSFVQQAGGVFVLTLAAASFSASFNWYETYVEQGYGRNTMPATNENNTFTYQPSFTDLVLAITMQLAYSSTNDSYTFSVTNCNVTPPTGTPNIPSGSIINGQDQSCFTSSVSTATENEIDNLNFPILLTGVIPAKLASIGAQIALTTFITYDFGSGTSGLTFPNDTSIAVGGTGTVAYTSNGTATGYPGTVPADLPVPTAPTTGQHLTLYVAAYELNALYWAYFQAGLLSFTVMPSDLSDPEVLAVKTYIGSIAALVPYSSFKMQAVVTPQQAPTTSFQELYIISTAAMQALQADVQAGTLPQAAYTAIYNNLDGNIYLDTTSLESDLNQQGVASQYYSLVEQATGTTGAVVTHDLQFQLNILTTSTPQPNIIFSVTRTDVLTNLQLGTTNGAQTLLFNFTEVTSAYTFGSSTVPNFPSSGSGLATAWNALDQQYSSAVAAMGATGVALPILSGFGYELTDNNGNTSFDISIQPQGYVAITANVQAVNG
jgi:hypothetical protein